MEDNEHGKNAHSIWHLAFGLFRSCRSPTITQRCFERPMLKTVAPGFS